MLGRQFSQPRLMSSQQHFSNIPQANIPRSIFDRSHGHKTTFNSSILYPIFTDEVLPGDTLKLRTTTFARLATPRTPFMDNLYADIHYFFVPNRLTWEHWEKFISPNSQDLIGYLTPKVRSGTAGTGPWVAETIADYLGWPVGITPSGGRLNTAVAFYTRAYNLIWNTWFRDETLQAEVTVDLDDGPDDIADYVLLPRGKRKDYFTSSLLYPQGNTDPVQLPLGTQAPVYGPEVFDVTGAGNWAGYNSTTAAYVSNGYIGKTNAATTVFTSDFDSSPEQYIGIPSESQSGVNQPYADLQAATAATINDIRQAITLQQYWELNARGGTRYVEFLKSHFGVTSPDFRLQRPEYIGGGSTMINTSPVPMTAESTTETPQGNLAAVGTFSHSGPGFNYSAVEHGVIIGLLSVRADLTYQQGMNKMFTRNSQFDYYDPIFAHLGEQSVLSSEIYYDGTADDDDVFGYQERHAEYRYKPSMVTGQFRSNFTTPLDFWHLAQDFATRPVLDDEFIVENPPVDRVIALELASGYPQFLLDTHFSYHCARPMPVYSIPGIKTL